MIRNSFKEEEIPYGVLETFGLTREMVEDLPLRVLQQISNGRRSPVYPFMSRTTKVTSSRAVPVSLSSAMKTAR